MSDLGETHGPAPKVDPIDPADQRTDEQRYFDDLEHDRRDPDPWLALYLDQNYPMAPAAKADLLMSMRSRSRQFLLPVVRPTARFAMVLIQVLKIFVPNSLSASKFLHWLIAVGLDWFVRPDANRLILRHMHIGSEILAFIAANSPGVEVPLTPLRPRRLVDLRDEMFLQHDLNLFNFVIAYNREAERRGGQMESPPLHELDFSMITDGPFAIDPMPKRWLNVIDVQTAVEIYTPLYQLFLTDNDFWRASNSLQLDETIAVHVAALLRDAAGLAFVNNKHPMVPMSTLRAGFRLMLHGLAAEGLHALLVRCKHAQARGELGTVGKPGLLLAPRG